MIQIVPVESKIEDLQKLPDFFSGKEHFYTMEMQDGSTVIGSGLIYIKGECAYLLSLEINDQSAAYMIFDSILRSLMNLASHHGAILFNANELNPLMNYFKKNEFCEIVQFSSIEEDLQAYSFYVNIESFFAKPCKG
jgi:hypothetical protein